MKTIPTPPILRRRKKGSIMMYSVAMLTVTGVTVISFTKLVNHNIHQARRAEERLQAFYIAEAGVQRAIDWFNRPDHSPDPYYFEPLPNGKYVDATGTSKLDKIKEFNPHRHLDVNPDHPVEGIGMAEIPLVADFEGGGAVRGRISALVITPPSEGDPPGTIGRVTCVGETVNKVKGTVEVVLNENRIPEIKIPAAIISMATAGSNGLFDVFWGEIWSRDNLELPHPLFNKFPPLLNKYPTANDDRWFGAKTEGHLVYLSGSNTSYADGSVQGGSRDTPIPVGSANYYIPYLESVMHPKNTKYYGYENLKQHQVLDFPDYDYESAKILAFMNELPIYRTTTDGKLIVGADPVTGNPIIRTFEAVFDQSTSLDPDDVDREVMPPIYFIDTTDGQPPRPDGGNMATIRVTGNGPFFHGIFFMAANIYFGGAGNSPQLDNPRRPDGTLGKPIKNCRLYGLLYSYGTATFQGQGDVYGAVFAQKGFSGGGSWAVYYDSDLGDTMRNQVGSKMRPRMWNSY